MKVKTVATHDGIFHADEIFAIAILKIVYPDLTIIRTRDKDLLRKADLRIDVGGKYSPETGDYDHHLIGGCGERKNGIPYAACGLIWKHFGRQLAQNKTVWERIDKKIIQTIDSIDNGYYPDNNEELFPYYTICDVIDLCNPVWYEDPDLAEQYFEESLQLAIRTLHNELKHAKGHEKAKNFVRDVIHHAVDPRFLVFDMYCPWQEIVTEETDALYVIFPATTNDWRVRAVPIRPGSFKVKLSLPSKWAGKSSQELAEITGVKDAVFCHPSCFIAGAASKEGAIALVHKALDS